MVMDWQNLAALALVLVSLFYLVWRVGRRIARVDSGGCSSCAGCPAASGQKPELISLDPPRLQATSERPETEKDHG